jgi:nucleotide-binding universal stress UspA family protein
VSEPVIVVPLDGSEHALVALPVAKVLGDVERATLRIVHVGERKPIGAELFRRLRLKASVLGDSTIDARVGESAAEILLVVRETKARLIVMCTYTAAKSEKVLGSTAMNVLRKSDGTAPGSVARHDPHRPQ